MLVEIERFFPSSKTCSNCLYQLSDMPLDIREWTCPSCGAHHDRDENASKNIRAEGIRQLSVLGTRAAAEGGEVRVVHIILAVHEDVTTCQKRPSYCKKIGK